MDAVADVKERLSIEDVVAEYVNLKRSGRNFKGLCPFHSEKTPSFMVNPERGIYHCFGCNEGGDIFSFVMRMEGLEFRQALELLARKSGVDLEKYGTKPGVSAEQKERLVKILELAAKYYQTALVRNDAALSYVKRRGLKRETLVEFKVGYAPDKDNALQGFLSKRGYKDADLKAAGLTSSGRVVRDMFRSRVVLPLCDGQGRVIGFTGRLIKESSFGPKYINSPQTLVYDKSRHIYGLHLAKNAIREKGTAVLVEGNMDVIASHQAGVRNVIATAGTALTIEQLKQLSRLADKIILAFDNDAAGLKATIRAIELAQKVKVKLMVVPLEGGKDPDDLIRQSSTSWSSLLERPVYALDWLIGHYEKEYDLQTAPGKKDMTEALAPIMNTLSDSVEQEHYVKVLASKLDVSVDAIKRQLNPKSKTLKKRSPEQVEKASSENRLLPDTYLSLIVRYPETRVSLPAVKNLSDEDDARTRLLDFVREHPDHIFEKVPDSLRDLDEFVTILMFKAEELYGRWTASDRVVEAIELAQRLGKLNKNSKLNHLTKKIKAAEEAGDESLLTKLLDEYQAALSEE